MTEVEDQDVEPVTVEFMGEDFAIADRIGIMPIMLFAKASQAGTTTEEMAGLVAMYDLLEQYISEAHWPRFCQVASKARASSDEVFAVVGEVLAAQSGRPTSRPSGSSDGPSDTGLRSMSEFESRAIALRPGRPDLQVAIVRSLQEQAS